MPTYKIQAPDGRIVNLEGDSAPSEAELENIFASLPPAINNAKRFLVNTPTVSSEQQAVNQFIKSQQAGPITKLGTQLGDLLNNFVVQPVKSVGGAVSGLGEVSGEASTEPQTIGSMLLQGGPFGTRATPAIAQNIAEAGARGAFDLGNAIDQFISKAATNPVQTIGNLSPFAPALNLLPHTPTQSEIDQFISDQNAKRGVQSVKSAPLLPEVLGNTNVPLANNLEVVGTQVLPFAGQIGKGISALATPLKTAQAIGRGALETVAPQIAARTAPATVEQSAMAALDFTPAQVQEHIPVVTQRVSELIGKVPKTANEAVKFLNDAEGQLYNERLETNHVADKAGYVVKGDEAIKAASDVLDSLTTITDTEKASILSELTDLYSGDKKPSVGQKIQQDLNKKFSAAYDNGTIDRANPRFQAEKAIRDSMAGQMDELTQAITGRAETPYADIGSLIEVKGNLSDKLSKLQAREAAVKTGIEASPSKIPTSKTQAAAKAGRSILSPFQRTQIEKLDQNVQRIFSESPKQLSASELPPDVLSQLRQSKAPSVVSNALEDQITQLIQSYPRNIRSNPFLARTIAEAELGQQRFNELGQTVP